MFEGRIEMETSRLRFGIPILLVLALVVLFAAFAPPAQAQNYSTCYFNFDDDASGVNIAANQSRIFVTVEADNFSLLLNPSTDGAIRDIIFNEIELLGYNIEKLGQTGILIRRDKTDADITCAISTNDTALKVTSAQLVPSALIIDFDTEPEGAASSPGVAGTINGATSAIPTNLTDTDDQVATAVADFLDAAGYLVSQVGAGVVVRATPTGTVHTALVNGGTSLDIGFIVPPICLDRLPIDGECRSLVTLEGYGFTDDGATTVSFTDGMLRRTAQFQSLVGDPNTQPGTQFLTVKVPAGFSPGPVDIEIEREGFVDCCVFSILGTCESIATGQVPAASTVSMMVLMGLMFVLGCFVVRSRF